MSKRERMIRETEEFLERELNRDTGNTGCSVEPHDSSRITIPSPPCFDEEDEDALFVSASELLHQPSRSTG